MRIVVASTFLPFGGSSSRRTAADLAATLRGRGHDIEEVWFPMQPDPHRALERMLSLRLTDISHAGDLMIAVRAPTHLLEHPRKIVWFEPDDPDISDPQPQTRAADRAALSGASQVFSTSVAAREYLLRTAAMNTEIISAEALADRMLE